jgi:hypothetical protein
VGEAAHSRWCYGIERCADMHLPVGLGAFAQIADGLGTDWGISNVIRLVCIRNRSAKGSWDGRWESVASGEAYHPVLTVRLHRGVGLRMVIDILQHELPNKGHGSWRIQPQIRGSDLDLRVETKDVTLHKLLHFLWTESE